MIFDNELLDKYIRNAVPGVPVFNTDEVVVEPHLIVKSNGELEIDEFSIVVPRRNYG